MKHFVVEKAGEGRRLDRWMASTLPSAAPSMVQKFLRLKRVRVNGTPGKPDTRLAAGDQVDVYVEDSWFAPAERRSIGLERFHVHLTVVYEDEHVLLVDKRPGMMVHPDANEKGNTLLTHVHAYLYQKGERGPFQAVLVNRIDRFTGGIVIVAKTETAMRVLNQKIRDRELDKRYLCAVRGTLRPSEGELQGAIIPDTAKARVTVAPVGTPTGKTACTRYWTRAVHHGISLVECELVTGRTHQIRAQMAAAGHPIIGDTQYGDAALNERYDCHAQALYAYALTFRFTTDAGLLAYLNGRTFQVRRVPFVENWFPGYAKGIDSAKFQKDG